MKSALEGFRKSYRHAVKVQAAKYDMTEKEYHSLNVVSWILFLAIGAFVFRKFRR